MPLHEQQAEIRLYSSIITAFSQEKASEITFQTSISAED